VACSGYYRPYEKIEWYVVPGKSFICSAKNQSIGCWDYPNKITLAREWLTTDWVVKHEIIHYLMQRGHWPGDTAVFGTKCKATWGYLENSDPNYRP
jgi:hypothetical protein